MGERRAAKGGTAEGAITAEIVARATFHRPSSSFRFEAEWRVRLCPPRFAFAETPPLTGFTGAQSSGRSRRLKALLRLNRGRGDIPPAFSVFPFRGRVAVRLCPPRFAFAETPPLTGFTGAQSGGRSRRRRPGGLLSGETNA
jgi:hypothetical protein